jgi:hypothetical protein
MTRRIAIAASFAAVTSLVAAADTPIAQNPVTLGGCVRSGSSASVFLLRGASAASEGGKGMPEDFLIATVPDRVNLSDVVNHRVEVTATISEPNSPPAAPQGANAAERALKRISLSNLKDVANNCGK